MNTFVVFCRWLHVRRGCTHVRVWMYVSGHVFELVYADVVILYGIASAHTFINIHMRFYMLACRAYSIYVGMDQKFAGSEALAHSSTITVGPCGLTQPNSTDLVS